MENVLRDRGLLTTENWIIIMATTKEYTLVIWHEVNRLTTKAASAYVVLAQILVLSLEDTIGFNVLTLLAPLLFVTVVCSVVSIVKRIVPPRGVREVTVATGPAH
ncbi:hypothetical protein PV04_09801 [Phialophora macrospora]|uniref:Uncharacterized protein n=1 Tax=Phialophora macrospora TaxID=1851006 RepID=A0A0D2F4W5_9EURO|nr:hypothetical protein PV04_09801 [Phialophora macrospora]